MLSQFKKQNVIYGPPGTGKTTFLLNILEQALDSGIPLENIGYMSFTKAAVNEAKSRAKQRLGQAKNRGFTYFTTLHSLCFRLLNLHKEQVISFDKYNDWGRRFCQEMHYTINTNLNVLDENTIITKDDRMCLAEQRARNLCISLEELYKNYDDREFLFEELVLFRDSLTKFKKVHGLYDFADMLEEVAESDIFIPHLEQLFIDETQDLAELQWRVVNKLLAEADQIYIAGDDDQAIYTFAGASPMPLVNLGKNPSWNKIVLNKSYRVPKSIQKVAFSTLDRIPKEQRIEKVWSPREEEGVVRNIRSLYEIKEEMTRGSWGILGRTNKLAGMFTKELKNMGLRYTLGDMFDSVNADHITAIRIYEKLRTGGVCHRNSLNILTKYIKEFKSLLEKIPYDFIQAAHFPTAICKVILETPWYHAFNTSTLSEANRLYYRELLSCDEDLTGDARINCLTMHSAKGKEWDNVVVIYDISEATMRSLRKTPGDEYRVLYVGETRAKQNLFRMIPSTQNHYPFVY